PELYHEQYFYYTGIAAYVTDIERLIWDRLRESNRAVDSVLQIEKHLSQTFPTDAIYSYEERNGVNVRVYSKKYCQVYHEQLNGMVERRLVQAIQMLSSIWYTC